jgi:hypothetical protein
MPGMAYGAAAGLVLGGLFMWTFSEAFRRWHDYLLCPLLSAAAGSIVAWGLTGGAGVIRYLRER